MKTEVLKNFIVLEGLDGSGTTTQLHKLSEELTKVGKEVYKTFEPTDDPIGKLIRSILRKEISQTPVTVSKLFVSDRYEHINGKDGVRERVNRGEVVVCDRYLFSSLAYQSPECGFDYVKGINDEFPLPEHLFFISVPVEICQERMDKRGEIKELFDAMEYQKKVNDNYHHILDVYKDSGMNIHIIDGTQTIENITKEILEIIR